MILNVYCTVMAPQKYKLIYFVDKMLIVIQHKITISTILPTEDILQLDECNATLSITFEHQY